MSASTADDVFDWAARDPGRAMFSREADGTWLPVTAGEFAVRVAAVAVFAENAQRAAIIRQAQIAALEAVWILEADALDRLARSRAQVNADEVLKRRHAVTPATPATIVCTSGTTGQPKGCVLSHGNLIAAIRAVTGAPGISEHAVSRAERIKRFRILTVTFTVGAEMAPPARSAGITCSLPTPATCKPSTPDAGPLPLPLSRARITWRWWRGGVVARG
jgi:acyl-CoA synthetase (AMP-forming)/AMP-acid ligase II